MDVLPLYIVLLMMFPPALWLLIRNASLALAASVALYVLTWEFGWNIESYPSGHWFFNPFAWQLLFVFGAWCALGGATRLAPALRSPVTTWLAIAYLVFAFGVTLTWYFPRLGFLIPHWLGEWMYPIDKTNLDVLRFAHFLALAALTVRFIPRDWPVLQSPWLRPAILCGQHSLEIFCLGVFLAFAAHFVMVEFYGGTAMQVLMSMAGILIMIGTALADLVVQAGRRPRLGDRRSGRRMPTLPEARHEEVDRPGASGRGGRDRFVQCGRARRTRRPVRGSGLSAVRRQPARARQRRGHQGQGHSRSWRWAASSSTLPGPDGA